MKLSALLKDAGLSAKFRYSGADREILGITDDTRSIAPGYIFVCVKGGRFDGHTAAEDMLKAGAAAVVCDHDLGLKDRQIIVNDSRIFYGHLCAAWFGHPERRMKLVGITGTNGKTTMATMIHSILSSSGVKTGFIGTTGVLIGNAPIERDESTPTTPKVFELYEIFAKMAAAGCTHAVMEVSSFAAEQNRIGPAKYAACVFTNLTRDHLDYHITMENYYNAKKKLFTDHCSMAFINTEDEYGKRLMSEISCEKYSYGITSAAMIHASDISCRDGASSFLFCIPEGRFPFNVKMIGSYNISNAVAAIAVCAKLGLPIKQIHKALSDFKGVRGRCEIIPTGRSFMVVCDYAHSPDALENMLPSIKEHTKGRLICLFGCGGDRDRTKRPLMAKAAAAYSDYLIVTSDNPRSEDPNAIIDEILTGLEGTDIPYDRITDRKEAIFHAVRIAREGDIIVLAGKGHEDYQIIDGNDTHIHFDEREIVAEALAQIPDFSSSRNDISTELTLEDICKAVSGKPYGISDMSVKVAAENICSDTRKIRKGCLFVGLKGERFDGNTFAAEAVEKGAIAAVTNRLINGVPCIITSDTGKALLSLAEYYRRRFSPVLVGITGSVAKTTTKEMTALALSSKYNTMKTEGNLNNEIGMPFTVLRLNNSYSAAVIEMGMSHSGEIERMSKVCKPDICIITNIGFSHIENLGSQEGIRAAKLEILKGAKPDAPLIVNGDDKLLSCLKEELSSSAHKVITCGIENPDCDFRAVNISSDGGRVLFDITGGGNTVSAMLPCMGMHHVLDAVIAYAAAVTAGCDGKAAAEKLKSFRLDGLRQHIEKRNGQTIIVDCYNAAPASMKAAIDVLCEMKPEEGGKRVCVLGDMLELGDMSPSLHEEIGEYAAVKGVDLVVCYGTLAKYIAKRADELGLHTGCSDDKEMVLEYLRAKLDPKDIVLFKASRGMHMEEIISGLYGE
ncbi:MAG: UDP-N-acetylmuramoyl-L-alanyl-D-glutamate--2,6-diaminopimelate ligase [Huintestinicola sp.]